MVWIIFSAMDEILPRSILDSTQNVLAILGSMILITVVNPYFLLPVSIISIFCLYARNYYLETSKNVKRLEGIGKWIRQQINEFMLNYYFQNYFLFSFSQIASIYTFECYFEWITNNSRLQKAIDSTKRIWQSSRYTFGLCVYGNFNDICVWLIFRHFVCNIRSMCHFLFYSVGN